MTHIDTLLAEQLLDISAIQLQPLSPFVWATGWNSPIYTDLRKALSYPSVRNFIKVELSRIIMENFRSVQLVASASKGAIAHGALVADTLGLPFAYVLSTPKDHGLENLIEGNITPGQHVVIVEDQISTGNNSLKAAQALRDAGADVLGMVAMFDYEFPCAQQSFEKAGIKLCSITNYSAMIQAAVATHYIKPTDVSTLDLWRQDPENWTPSSLEID